MSMGGVQQSVSRRRDDGVPGIFSGSNVAYFLLGGAVGAIAALLLAPKSGRELRADIADTARKGVEGAREKAVDYYGQTRERATEFYETAKSQVGDVTSAARAQVARGGETISAAIEAGKRAYADEKRRTQSSAIMEPAPTYYEEGDKS
ncbi:MAG: YtxH domain-containing protein [Acidobacteriota bacterium]|nr:YtxH domain-containing protein [Acidobacteriota bacterium]